MSLASFQRRLDRLSRLTGVERAREARELSDVALAELAAAGDEGVFDATRGATYAEVADQLEVTVSAVGKAIRRHNAQRRALSERIDSDNRKAAIRPRRT